MQTKSVELNRYFSHGCLLSMDILQLDVHFVCDILIIMIEEGWELLQRSNFDI